METGTGIGVYERQGRVQLSVSLDYYATVFKVEVMVIYNCVNIILKQGTRNKSISIYSNN